MTAFLIEAHRIHGLEDSGDMLEFQGQFFVHAVPNPGEDQGTVLRMTRQAFIDFIRLAQVRHENLKANPQRSNLPPEVQPPPAPKK